MKPAITDCRAGDETDIVALFREVFGTDMTPSQWHWKYRGRDPAPPLSKVARDPEGALLGHAGAIALPGRRQGRDLPCYQICDVMVHPRARGHLGGRNLFTRMIHGLLEEIGARHAEVFAYGFPGERPFLLGERAGAYGRIERVPEFRWQVGTLGRSWLGASRLDWDDRALDRIWGLWTRHHSDMCLTRDGAYLRWRYAENPFHRYELLGIRGLGRLLGWAVVRRDGAQRLVVDLLVPRRWLGTALRAVDGWCARDQAETAKTWLPSGWRAEPGIPEAPSPIVATNMIWHLPLTTDEVRRELYYTMGDVDVF